MEPEELLGLIDVIRNEKLYTERLLELKKLQEQIKVAKYVSVTMEQADKYRNECEELKNQAEENLRCIEEEVENRVKTRIEKLKADEAKLDDERRSLEQFTRKLEEEQRDLFKRIQNYKQLQENLRKRGDELSAMQKQASHERLTLANKVDQINKIFNKD